jgi:hypothetical protein
MKRRIYLLIIPFVIIFPLALAAQDGLSLQGSTDKKQITIGDRLNYSLTFTYPENFKLAEPDKTNELGLWTVKDVQAQEEKKTPQIVRRITYTLTTFTTGQVAIPELTFKYTNDKNEEKTVNANPIDITVESVLAKAGAAADIRDIKPPLTVPVPLSTYLLWLTALAAAGVAGWWWYTNYRRRSMPLEPANLEPPVPPYQKATDALEKLKVSGLVTEGKIKEFYIALCDIIRDYLGAIYDVDTREKTTAEMYSQLRHKEADKKILSVIKDFFDECDLVKFAKYRPDEAGCWQDWEIAKKIVEGKAV